MNNVTHHPHAAHRYQSRGILSMPKLNLKPTGGKMAFLMEEGGHQIWGWEWADLSYFSVALPALSISDDDLDGNGLASTGNLVQPLVPVKWLGLSVTPCPSVSIWWNMDFPFERMLAHKSNRPLSPSDPVFRASNHMVIIWQKCWHPKSPCRHFIGNVFAFTASHVLENRLQLHRTQRESSVLKCE